MGALDATDPLGLGFLQLRKQLKQKIRNDRMKGESNSATLLLDLSADQNKSPTGSFFGASENSIAPRLIEEYKTLMPELKRLASKTAVAAAKPKPPTAAKPKPPMDEKSKRRAIRESRESYADLLSGKAEIPKAPKPEAKRVGQDPARKLGNMINPGSSGVQRDSRPAKIKSLAEKERPLVTKKPPLKRKAPELNDKTSSLKPPLKQNIAGVNYKVGEVGKTCALKLSAQSAPEKQCQPKKVVKRCRVEEDDWDDYDDVRNALSSAIRGFGPRRKRFVDDDDDDDLAMVSSFADIEREEKRSASIAREEDEQERLRIEEEEKQERLRRAKKQKLYKELNLD